MGDERRKGYDSSGVYMIPSHAIAIVSKGQCHNGCPLYHKRCMGFESSNHKYSCHNIIWLRENSNIKVKVVVFI